MLIKYFENQNLTINQGRTVQRKTTIISFTCVVPETVIVFLAAVAAW
jgi:hypothetical protein